MFGSNEVNSETELCSHLSFVSRIVIKNSNFSDCLSEIPAKQGKFLVSPSLKRGKFGSKLEYKHRVLLKTSAFAVLVPLTSFSVNTFRKLAFMMLTGGDYGRLIRAFGLEVSDEISAKFPAYVYVPDKMDTFVSFLKKSGEGAHCSLVKFKRYLLKGSDLVLNGLFIVVFNPFYDLSQSLFLTPGYFAANIVDIFSEPSV